MADSLLKPIEDTYPTWRGEQPVNYIVVLGGGYTWNPQWAPSSNLINNSLPRLNEGIRLWRRKSRFENDLYRRGGENEYVSTAEVGREWRNRWAYRASDIIVLDLPKIQKRKRCAVKRAIGDAPFLLVTSASHLPRAMIFFAMEGIRFPRRPISWR